ncbi:MAG: T9SS type A sorting domain-containing protein [Aureispira sp.]|nr:T9SS type A sorting domain-containing protein [Aureispira sp.]
MRIFTILSFLFLSLSLSAQINFYDVTPSNITQTSLQLDWSTSNYGQTEIRYGLTPALELGAINLGGHTLNHTITLNNLSPATFYYIQPVHVYQTTVSYGDVGYYSTRSNSSGEIRAIFNQSIDPSYSSGTAPYIHGSGTSMQNELISMINNAKSTIDVAVYNNSLSSVVSALTAAHNNGVRVRYIANIGTANTALTPAPAFPVYYVNSSDHMHHKFFIFDADSTNSSWVWSGSANLTSNGIFTDYNHAVTIQDESLAKAYRIEFEEMWGSSTASYNTTNAKIGTTKTDNTPHIFNIGGSTVELYFSPSDKVSWKIDDALNTANNDIEFSQYIFTYNLFKYELRDRKNAGVAVHGIIDEINASGSDYAWLQTEGVNVVADNHSAQLHHKYALVDAGVFNSDPQVITGSHNWTSAAEFDNDENTLIIHDATITNHFLQEFTKRWCEVKNNISCQMPFTITGIEETLDNSTTPLNIYPNPAHSHLYIDDIAQANIRVFHVSGQQVYAKEQVDTNLDINVQDWENGIYLVEVTTAKNRYLQKVMILH